jgi:hypothetical protein
LPGGPGFGDARLRSHDVLIQVFLSHNHRDKDFVRSLAAQLRLVGVDVWLDEWEIWPGDRIYTKVNSALDLADTVVVVWSANAADSRWVEAELATALEAELSGGSSRIVPVRLDDTPLPALLRAPAWVDGKSGPTVDVARRLANIQSDNEYIKAVQAEITEAGFEYEYFHGYGVAVGCPRCGASVRDLEQWVATDLERDDEYAGARCTKCSWNDGGEI